ncbi:hypothetical protein Tco_1370272 [Tanacetum coccineum]
MVRRPCLLITVIMSCPSVEERALLFLEARDRVKKRPCLLLYLSYIPHRPRRLTYASKEKQEINEVYERIMARMEERLDQFVDQFANRMNDMMYPRRREDRNSQRNEGEESENPFSKGDGSSLFAEIEE